MEVVRKDERKLEQVEKNLTFAEANQLWYFLDFIRASSQSFGETVGHWIHYNQKKLIAVKGKIAAQETEVRNKYGVLTDPSGSILLCVPSNPALGQAIIKEVDGRNRVWSLDTKSVVEWKEGDPVWVPVITDEDEREAHDTEAKGLYTETFPVNVKQINRLLITSSQLPARDSAGNLLDIDLFYETLVTEEKE